jgi:hypothetical protein
MARIRTLNFLPEIFQTPTNSQFLSATLDRLVSNPSTTRVQGYVGSKFGSGINALDYYVTEPTKVRSDYQLDPSVVFTKEEEAVANDFITYPGIIDSLEQQGAVTGNNNRLFNSQIYSWDSFTNLDKLVNYYEYYWLPTGAPAVTVSPGTVFINQDYVVTDFANAYEITEVGSAIGPGTNPTLSVLRGGTYSFEVNQDSQFWIQTEPGVSGVSPTQSNLPTREVFGVNNNGASEGIVTFNVPFKNAQDQFIFPGNNIVDVICNIPFDDVNGRNLYTINDIATGISYPGLDNIDGVTGLNGLRIMFYDTGVPEEQGYISSYYDETFYDVNDPFFTEPKTVTVSSTNASGNRLSLAPGFTTDELVLNQTVTFTGILLGGIVEGQVYFVKEIINSTDFTISEDLQGDTFTVFTQSGADMIVNTNQGQFQNGFNTVVSENFYRILYLGDPDDPIIRLIPDGTIPNNEKITPRFGNDYINRSFYRNNLGVISVIPIITAPLDVLYYQDGTNPNKVGIIKIADSDLDNFINIETEILGRTTYTSPNGVTFTNGLKVQFDGNVFPNSYRSGEYYVEGVGTAIELIPVDSLIVPEKFSRGNFVPYDTVGYDDAEYDLELFVPVDPDYITIARDSISKNAWSRSNRWFHIDVINATAQYNDNANILTQFATLENKAKRPIIEFYPNLKMFNSGSEGKRPVDFFDTRETDALSEVAGLNNYFPDVETYTGNTAVVVSSPTTIVSVPGNILTPEDPGMQAGKTYIITDLGSTTQSKWNLLAGTLGVTYFIGDIIVCSIDGNDLDTPGTGQGQLVYDEATIVIPNNAITGTFQIGMFVGDVFDIIPTNAQIINLVDDGTNTTLTISYPFPQNIVGGTTSMVGTDTTASNYAVFPGSRIIFSNDTDESTKHKVYVVDIVVTTLGGTPEIVLIEAEDTNVEVDQQVVITRGFNEQGKTFYFDGIKWLQSQQKVTVNQAPLFDVFDDNGISFSDSTVYNSTSFTGTTLFSYGINPLTVDDPILGFPVRFTDVGNIGDLSFDVTINSDTFNYVRGIESITQQINTGYVHNYINRIDFTRELGWVTAVEDSVQYQEFNFKYSIAAPTTQFVCDIAALPEVAFDSKGWPRVKVYNNNRYLEPTDYTVELFDTATRITLNSAPVEDTVIQVLLLSDQVSQNGFYQIPDNLNNNPFNADLTVADLGDIRNHYQDIFINAPNTTGDIFGSNNYRDCGDLTPYGTKIIQNSASMVLPGVFLRKTKYDLLNALMFNSNEYVKFKQLLVDTVQNTQFNIRNTPAEIVDESIEQIAASKSEISSFYWSDMLPNRSPLAVNTYNFNSNVDVTRYPLSKVYNFESANYDSVLVYLNRTVNNNLVQRQLLRNVDYTISADSPTVTVTLDLVPGDQVVVKEYNQTYGSFVPYTPSKLGLYDLYEPSVVLDSNYSTPTYFIKGHDGSFTKLYGTYVSETDTLFDFRDQALLEFEKRVYNNVKLSTEVPIKLYDVLPGFFRDSNYSYNEWLQMYSTNFLNWVGQNRIDYKTQFYNRNNEFTYNYTNSSNKLNNAQIQQGYWRGAYQYLYDTTTPNLTPWEMLAFANKPSWWETRYGPAPYTSDNLVLWGDLEAGRVYSADGTSVIVPELARPGLTSIIPVNSSGNLLSPLNSIVGNYNPNTFQKDWKVGDDGPAELSYRRSSTYPFDVIKLFALTKPAEFYNLAVDLDNYKYNAEFNQYLVNDRTHLIINNVDIYGDGVAKTSYINWIVDYEKQFGVDATQEIKSVLNNLDVRLAYRLAGYSDKTLLKFYVEKGSPNTANASLLIPDESYQVILYDNQPFDKVVFSSIIIQKTVQGGFTVYGNSQSFAYFTIKLPINSGRSELVTVLEQRVKLATDYSSQEVLVPYGTTFYSIQEVAQFIMSYNAYLTDKGMKFNEVQDGTEINWELMVKQFMYWSQMGWDDGSLITLNPAATDLVFDKEGSIVQPLTIQQQNFILNQDLYPIQINTLCINRDGTMFKVHTLNEGDSMAFAQFNVSNFEHGIVFNNTTLFNDVIYNLVTGLRQNRITLRGTKTSAWNGTVDAWGFIINQDNVKEWSKDIKYPKGSIVLHKNKYYAALRLSEPSTVFNDLDWKLINYDDVQKGLLPNSATRSYESTLYYNCNAANLEQDADLLSFSLIGYRPRDYLALADLTDITQINVYKNMIKNKGTVNAVTAFNGVTLPQGGIEYEVYENWAIKSGDYGGLLSQNFVEFNVDQYKLTGNPSIVSLTNGIYTEGSQQEVPIYSLFNYGDTINDPNVLAVTTDPYNNLYPSAGYTNFNDVKMSSFYFGGLPNGVNKDGLIVPIQNFYVRDYMWLASFKEKWGVFSWSPIGEVVEVTANLNNTATVTFSKPHNLKNLDPVAIVNFSVNVDGYYIVTQVVNLTQVIINLNITDIGSNSITGSGVGMLIYSQRVAQPGDINTLPLLEAEFTKNTVWVDENTDGGWAVYRKGINYARQEALSVNTSSTFGSSVAFTEDAGYLIADSATGTLYRYYYNDTSGYRLAETITNDDSFGARIVHNNDTFVISQPTTDPTVYVYVWNNTALANEMLLAQTIPAPAGVTDWGSELAISGDGNWVYVSAYTPDTNPDPIIDNSKREVYVYRKNNQQFSAGYFVPTKSYIITELGTTDFTLIGAVENRVGITFVATGIGSGAGTANNTTYDLVKIIDGAALGLDTVDNFGKSISTNFSGDCLFVGAPNKDYSVSVTDWGEAYFYQRSVQKFESTSSTLTQPQFFALGWTPTTATKAVTATTGSTTNTITLANVSGIAKDDAITFVGTAGTPGLAGTDIIEYKTYYVAEDPDTVGNTIQIKESRSTNDIVQLSTVLSISNATAHVQSETLIVNVNGRLVQDNNYAVVGSTLVYSGPLNAGDIVEVSGNEFYNVQTFNAASTDRINIQFGYDLDVTSQASELLIGSPFEIDSVNREGLVYRFTNGGARFGIVVGESECNLTSTRNILINGYLVTLTAGNAQAIANLIANSRVPNVTAAATSDNKLIIQIVDPNLAEINNKLMVTAFDSTTLDELGISIYSPTQVINCPHKEGPTEFGKTIKFNQFDSVVIAAPAGPNFVGTTFDFTDDENLDNDTVFDNNATRFVENYPNAGAVYMFDLLSNNNGSLLNPGAFVYAQPVNSSNLDFVINPYYGEAVDFYANVVIVGAPNQIINPLRVGQVTTFVNATGVRNWSEFRQSAPIVDINKIQNTQLFSASTNNTLINLDYMDPLQNKLLGAIRENIDYVSPEDPAKYNVDPLNVSANVWGSLQVGKIWFNTSTVRFVNYHQNDVVYNSEYWGTVFPGSDISVCTWIASNVLPTQYQGPGIPIDVTTYAVGSRLNASNIVTPIYYFWVRNSGLIVKERGKTLSDAVIASYIANPQSSGIAYMAPLLPNTFALYNSAEYINDVDSVFHIGFATDEDTDVPHNEFKLIRQNFADDFLPGLVSGEEPFSLYARMLDSLSGTAISGEIVPNPFLPLAVQSGVLTRPRQSFFYNRFEAVKNYLTYANAVLAQYPIVEIKPDISFAFVSDEFYNTKDYWEYINWWAPGYNNSTRAFVQVPLYADLAELNVSPGTLVKVENNGTGSFEIYRYSGNNVWSRIGLENGTIEFSSALWDYDKFGLGYGNDFYDTIPYDDYPSEATRNIIRLLNEQIYTQELLIHRNKSLILLLEYIQTETTESQNHLPWLNKTSLLDVFHTVRELRPFEVFKSDNVEFLEGYLNEVKPYHVVIKEFLVKYDGIEEYAGNITDFDVPAVYNNTFEQFISPQLVFSEPDNIFQYDESSPIWSTAPYTQWYQNYGLSLTGQENYLITTLKTYMDLGSNTMLVDNASGFPTNGVIQIGEELISYAYVDRNLNLLGGLSRGFNNTQITEHIPDSDIFVDLPAVVVLDEGSGYTQVPKITAYIDTALYPAPRKEAILQAVMSGGRVSAVQVIDPGEGYVVLPEIRIDPAYTVPFSDTDINASLGTININAPLLRTGQLVKFRSGTNGAKPTNLVNDAWYYVGVLESLPSVIISLYNSYSDAIKDQNRIDIAPGLPSNDMTLSPGARASTITSSAPTRENNINLRFDRTTYNSQVVDWESGTFYGAFFAGTYYNSDKISSSSITLQNTDPDIDTILASAQGVALQITDVTNEAELVWSAFTRYVSGTSSIDNSITLIPQDSNNPDLSELEPNASGTTIGFYIGMPIKFVGAVGLSNLFENTTYYVSEIIDELKFSVSDTRNGATKVLTTSTVFSQLLECYSGNINETVILSVEYPGIIEATQTQRAINAITVPLSPVGTGGTLGFYTGLPVFFTGDVFGGIIENLNYYVTSVIDDQTFTLSETENPVTVTIKQTKATGNILVVESIIGISRNDPIIITDLTGGLLTANEIIAGRTYYVSQIISSTEITISEVVNGPELTVSNRVGTATLTNQKDTVKLTNATGSMTMNVSLPVSPGQVNGQLFTLYETSGQFTDIPTTGANYSNLIERPINATIGTVNKIAIPPYNTLLHTETGTDFFYVNMPIQVLANVGGLVTGTTYYVTEYSGRPLGTNPETYAPSIQVEVTNSSDAGPPANVLTCTIDLLRGFDGTASLYEKMPIIFQGTGLGGIVINQEYFVKDIVSATQFTISETVNGPVKPLTLANGIMIGTGDLYIKVSTSKGGSAVALTNNNSGATSFTQFITVDPVFDISYLVGGYSAIMSNPGEGFATNNTILIPGTAVDGTAPANNILLTVNDLLEDSFGVSSGGIKSVIRSGTPPGTEEQYYMQVRSENTLAVYKNSLLTIPAVPAEFNYVGYTVASVTNSTTDTLTVDTTGFEENDGVVFTGNVPDGLVRGQTYYLFGVTSTTTQLTLLPDDPTPITGIVFDSEFTMAKLGSTALLPEPFYFNQSIVKFNNRVYECVISNNDDEFIFGKWELLDSGDRRLNAMDRVVGYYQPTSNMPGVDLGQLFEGTTYPNPAYRGNSFDPDLQYGVDTILTPLPFYPSEVDISGIIWNGDNYLASANLPGYNAILTSEDGETWTINQLTNNNINTTSISQLNGFYFLTAANPTVPILRSINGVAWSAVSYFVPFGTTELELQNLTSLNIPSLSLNDVAYCTNGSAWVSVGRNILRSDDAIVWRELTNFDSNLEYELNAVSSITGTNCQGLAAVGKGKEPDYSTGVTQLVDVGLIFYSQNSSDWTQIQPLTNNGLCGVASDGTTVIAVGERQVIYYTQNGFDWVGLNEVACTFVDSINDILNVTNTAGFTAGVSRTPVRFNRSFSTITAETTYYVESIVSSTQITLSDTLTGGIKTLTSATIPANTQMFVYDASDPIPATLNDILYANSLWITVGDEGTIKTSTDGIVWETRTSNTTNNLNNVTYNEDQGGFVVVGDNNTILTSADGISWEETSVFDPITPVYDVQGANFQFGYAPEELVAGVVSDNLALIVTTRPGTNWPVVEYGHAGYNVNSVELTPINATQVEYSFANLVNVPVTIAVQVINGDTELGTTLSPDAYTIDWITKTITLAQALSFSPRLDKLRIDVYETGNGDQLVKASTDTYPIVTNSSSGFKEINLACNYSAPIYEGGGALRPGTDNVNVRVFETESVTNRIFCNEVKDFTINSPITFQGVPFGGLQEETVYFVKTVNFANNTITVSTVFDFLTGIAGATTELSDATGEMFANIENGVGAVWTDPLVERNGEKLVFGSTGIVTRSTAINNRLTTATTSGLIAGTAITFGQSNPAFGVLVPFQRYFISEIVDGNEFTISEILGGAEVVLTDFSGFTTYVTNDYSIGFRDNDKAKLVFANNTFTNDTDYISFSIFGETQPDQYGYAIPETQYYTGNGSNSLFLLDNFVGMDNATNAVVEVNGVRQTISQYTIDIFANTILFNSPPPLNSVVAITTYNDTSRQYLTSQFDITGNPGSSLLNLTIVETVNELGTYDQDTPVVQTYDQDIPVVVLYDEYLNYLRLDTGYDTSVLNINDSLQFSAPTLGGIVAGQTYFVVQIINSTDFVISEEVGGAPFVVFDDTGSMPLLANGLTVAPIANISNNLTPPIAITFATATTVGPPNEITVDSTAGFVVNQPVQFFGTSFDANIRTDGIVYFVDSIVDSTTFTIKDFAGNQIVTIGDSGNMQVVVGGQPSVRVTTSIVHNFVENTLIRIDGTTGSVQLNNNTYYAKIIDTFTFDIYNSPYSSSVTAVNDPVTTIEAYTGGGYTWRQGLFFISTTSATATGLAAPTAAGDFIIGITYIIASIGTTDFTLIGAASNTVGITFTATGVGSGTGTASATNTINVISTDGLVSGTPVYFSEIETPNTTSGFPTPLMGGLTQGTLYYVKDVIDSTRFTVSSVRYGPAVSLTGATGRINVTQWAQENVDRLYVTINGYRVPSSKLKVNDYNEVSILSEVVPGDRVIISSMIPTATPNEETYINFVDNTGEAEVYRVSPEITTWVTQTVYPLATEIFVNDATKLTRQVVQDVTTPTTVNGFYYLGLAADKNLIANVRILNNTTGNFLPQEAISVVLIDLSPNAKIAPGAYITVGDELTITTLEGNLVYINGEQIRFNKVDFITNALQEITRGVNGTGTQSIIPIYSPAFGLLSINQLPNVFYNQTWNSKIYNTVEGDPLQISDTVPAQFLNNTVN